jgi:microcystin-dependent protein
MSEPFIGEVKIVAFNFPPKGWAFCNGQILSIAQNQALFSILGTTYGGNGVTTFALPNMQSRVPAHWGQGQGLSPVKLGEVGGVEAVTLTRQQMPTHNHLVAASSKAGDNVSPVANLLASGTKLYSAEPQATTLMPEAVGATGQNQPHPNIQPYLVLNYVIALVGIFPSRD